MEEVQDIAEIYQELRDRQRVIVFGCKTEEEAEQKRKAALGYVTEALRSFLKRHGYPERNL